MKRIIFTFSVIFALFAFAGSVYVVKNNDGANVFYTVVPALLSVLFNSIYMVQAE